MFTGSPQPAVAGGEEWRLAHQRALTEAHRDDLDGNESAPYGLSVPANPRILQMRGRGKGTGGWGEQHGAGAGKQASWRCPLRARAGHLAQTPPSLGPSTPPSLWLGTRLCSYAPESVLFLLFWVQAHSGIHATCCYCCFLFKFLFS